MLFLQQIQDNIAATIVPFFCACFVIYLGYHGLYGDHGLITMLRLNTEIERLEFDLAAMQEERSVLERRIMSMRPESLDVDLLEEQARAQLGFAQPNDLVIFDPLYTW